MPPPDARPNPLLLFFRILLSPFLYLYRLIKSLLLTDPLVILSPRSGDHVNRTFDVAGTYGGTTVSVSLSGDVSGSGNDVPEPPDWTVPFTVGNDGACTATASATGASSISVSFTIGTGGVPFRLNLPGFEPDPVPPGPPPVRTTKSGKVTIDGECPTTARQFQAHLDAVDGSKPRETITLTPKADGTFKDKFKKSVGNGMYVVQVDLVPTSGSPMRTTRATKV